MKPIFILFLSTFFYLSSYAQEYTMSGYIKDAETGETLIGATLYSTTDYTLGTETNQYGFYSLTIPQGNYNLKIAYIGYETQIINIALDKNLQKNIELKPIGITTSEVVITSEKKDKNVSGTQMGTVDLQMDKIKTLPAFMGEVDILKTVQLMPGVKNGGDGSTGFFVRGGGADQNLILLDDAVVYNTGHMLGFFSIFNADAVKNLTVIKGNMPAQYGGRLSSVLDVTMKEGNNKKFEVEGGIGIIASRLTVQGPLQKNKSSFIISARRTYVMDVVQPIIDTTNFKGTNYYFYDLNAKANYTFSDKDRLYVSGYFGRDVLKFSASDRGFKIQVPYGNKTATVRWNHLFNNKLFMNVSGVYNDYKFEFNGEQEEFKFKLYSGIKDWNLKTDFDYLPNPNHSIKLGVNYTFHTFTPNSATAQAGDVTFNTETNRKYAHEIALYIGDDWEISHKWSANLGLRIPLFQQVGPYTRIIYNSQETPIDTSVYAKNEKVKSYIGLEPRLSLKYSLNPVSSIKAGFTINNQFIHLVTGTSSTLPTDLWIPSSLNVKPQIGYQYALGYFRNFHENMFEASVETYYKYMLNQIEYKEGSTPQLNYDIENTFTFGKGEAYGIEFLLRKNKGKLTGWIGYTLSKTHRFFPSLNDGKAFNASYDRTHDLSVVLSYQLHPRWELGGAFIFYTGRAFTLPTGRFYTNNWFATEYTERNGYRLKPYNRADISITFKSKASAKFKSSWTLAFYNLYNRHNQDFIYFDTSINPTGYKIQAYQVSIFPIIPSLTWNFKI